MREDDASLTALVPTIDPQFSTSRNLHNLAVEDPQKAQDALEIMQYHVHNDST
jgi:hypothetical protein